jgi:hypothetical protein
LQHYTPPHSITHRRCRSCSADEFLSDNPLRGGTTACTCPVLEHLALFSSSQLYYYSVRLPFRGSGKRRKRIQEKEERRKKDIRRLLLRSMCGVSASSFPAAGLSISSIAGAMRCLTAPQHPNRRDRSCS